MALTDKQFALVSSGAGAVVVVILATLRFCGGVSLPAKPPAPVAKGANAAESLGASTESGAVWLSYVEQDAKAAGIRVPTLADMSHPFEYRKASTEKDLVLDAPPVELAGLRVQLTRTGNTAALRISNESEAELAYNLTMVPSTGTYVCSTVSQLPHNAMFVRPKSSELIAVCEFRDDTTVAVTLETMALTGLPFYYVAQVPPALVGIESKRARAHRIGLRLDSECQGTPSSGVLGGLSNGKITWRDLIDFYARHRCQTYRFPLSYRAFTAESARPLPVVAQDP